MSNKSSIAEISRADSPERFIEASKFLGHGIIDRTLLGEDYVPEGSRIFVIEDEAGRIVSAGMARPIDSKRYYLDLLNTREESRGAGLGSSVLGHIIGVAKEAGAARLEVDAVDYKARNFFEDRGFEENLARSAADRPYTELVRPLDQTDLKID